MLAHNTINFVFHGGSGSSVEEIREAIDYGAIKMNNRYRHAICIYVWNQKLL